MKRSKNIARAIGYLEWVHAHPRSVILLITIITLIFAWKLSGLKFRTSIFDLSVKDLPQTSQYEAFKKEFGPDDMILVVIRAEELFTPAVFAYLTDLSERLSKIQGVFRVISLPEIRKGLDTTGLWTLKDFEEAMGPLAVFQKSLISADGKTTVISLFLDEAAERDRVVEAVGGVLGKKRDVEAYQIGIPVVNRALTQYTEKDFLSLPPMVVLVIIGVLFLLFRNLQGILIPLGFVCTALVWTFGLMAWTGTPLSILTMIVPVFVIGVGTAYCMYILSEYFRSLEKTRSPRRAVQRCLLRTGLPTVLAVTTTTIGLGSLLLQRISAIREFALFTCFGVWSILILLLLLFPVLPDRLGLQKRRAGKGASSKGSLYRSLPKIAEIMTHRRPFIFALFGLISLFAVIGMTKIRTETDPVSYFKAGSPIQQDLARSRGSIAGCFPLNVVLRGIGSRFFEDPENLKIIKDLQQFLESREGVDKTISFADYLSFANVVSHQHEAGTYRLPAEASEVRRLTRLLRAMVGENLLKTFIAKDRSMVTILLRTHLSGSEKILRLKEKITAHLTQSLPKTVDAHVTGFGIMISESSRFLTRAQIRSLLLTLVLISAVMFLLFRSIRVGLIALVPNAFPILVGFGLMGWLGIQLSVGTSLVACVAIGLAVDDTIHFLVRYRRELRKTGNTETALARTLGRVGRPIIFTTLTIGVGFALLLLSHFQPTSLFGLLMVVTMVSALLGDLILLPSLLVFFDRSKK